MPLYAEGMDRGLAAPVPSHALTPAAEAAREAHRRAAAASRVARAASAITTDVGNRKPHGQPEPAAAKRVAKAARAAGFDVLSSPTAAGWLVEGIDRANRRGFRAHWKLGATLRFAASGGTWHEGPRDRYVMVEDERPVGVNKLTLTGLANRRAAGIGRTHLKLVASPRGVVVSTKEIEKRINE